MASVINEKQLKGWICHPTWKIKGKRAVHELQEQLGERIGFYNMAEGLDLFAPRIFSCLF